MREMKIQFLITLFIIILASVSTMIFATGVKTYVFNGNDWTEISNININKNATIQGTDNQHHGDPASPAVDPPATPMVYVSIEYTNISAHIDMPGQWMFGGVNITVIASHTPVRLTFSTSGDLSNGTKTIPTYYQKFDGNSIDHVPHQPLHACVWKRASNMDGFSMVRGIGNHSFKLWVGLDVGNNLPKGKYTGWIKFSIAQVP